MCGRLLLMFAVVLAIASPAKCLKAAQVQTIAGYINNLITVAENIGAPIHPNLVRLAFHDCVGNACDGCINPSLAANRGILAVPFLEGLYTDLRFKLPGIISRADFWALAGLVAANYAAKLQVANTPYIPASLQLSAFKTGRKDCATAPKGNEPASAYPDGLKTGKDTLDFFSNNFGFTAKEAVAIMGAHTLGSASPQFSDFGKGQWVLDNRTLNNAYYVDMSSASAKWAQTQATRFGASGGKIQWTRPAQGLRLLMLNADMGLLKAFSTNSTGGANCTIANCPAAASTSPHVAAYASNNTNWLDDFGAAFAKMQTVCGRKTSGSTTTITRCTLTPQTGARAATAPSVQARIAAATSSPQVLEVIQRIAVEAAAINAAAQTDEPLIDQQPGVVASADGVLPVEPQPEEPLVPAHLSQPAQPLDGAVQPQVVLEAGRRHH